MLILLPSAWRRLPEPLFVSYTDKEGNRTTDRPVLGDRVFTAKTTGNRIFSAMDERKQEWRSFIVGKVVVNVDADKRDWQRMKHKLL